MAKKKTVVAAKKSGAKSTPAKKSVASNAVKKPSAVKSVSKAKAAVKQTSSAVKKVAKKATTKTSQPKPVSAPKISPPPVQAPVEVRSEPSLGRPLVTQEEKLYWVFHEDFQARKVFEFLQVETVKELEQFSQQEIVHLLSKPTRMTVERIRQRLAQNKRCLKGDEQFATDYMRRSGQK